MISLLFCKPQIMRVKTILPVFPSCWLHLQWPIQGECNCEYPSDKGKQKNVCNSLVSIILSSVLTLLSFVRLSETVLQCGFAQCGFTPEHALKHYLWEWGSAWSEWMGRAGAPVWRRFLVCIICYYRDMFLVGNIADICLLVFLSLCLQVINISFFSAFLYSCPHVSSITGQLETSDTLQSCKSDSILSCLIT